LLLPILSLPTKEIVREHTPPKPKRSKENDSSENLHRKWKKETVDEGHIEYLIEMKELQTLNLTQILMTTI
jgi:hypothetical protein